MESTNCDQQNKFANIIDYYKFINSNIPLFNDNITLINYYSNSEDIINFNINVVNFVKFLSQVNVELNDLITSFTELAVTDQLMKQNYLKIM